MSTTTIYVLGTNPGEMASFRNSWRGAMYVWNAVAEKYWGLKNFPMFDSALQSKVWNTNRTHAMPLHEAIVLLSTMDGATVRTEDAAALVDAFKRFGTEHPNSSYTEQAAAIEQAALTPGGWLAWQATSVAEFWGQAWDAELDEYRWYDPRSGDRHIDVMAEARRHSHAPVAQAAATHTPAGPTTARGDLIVTAGDLPWMVRGAQLVDGQARFDWVEHRDRPGAVEVDDLYVRGGRFITHGGPKSAPVPMLMVLRRAICEAVAAKLKPAASS